MITITLLFIIYIAFISLGLPDSVMGVSWPAMRFDFGLALDQIGYVSIIITVATIISSLASGYLIDKFGTGKITLFSVFITALALFGISLVPSFFWIILLAFPLGFGAGSIDTALNNYVSLHYKAFHMNWLHGFWGVGATLGPVIMARQLAVAGWRNGFLIIAIIQLGFFAILLVGLPLWKKVDDLNKQIIAEETTDPSRPKNILKIPGVKTAVSIFIIYCAIEFSIGLWGSSYLVQSKSFSIPAAAGVMSIYYLGITLGRFISGFISFKLTNKQLIYCGIVIVFIGTLLLNVTFPESLTFVPFGIIGLGLSPIFPAMIHETPRTFGKRNSQYIIGFQMAGAYIGGTAFPPIFGFIATRSSLNIFPYYLFALAVVLLLLVNALYVTNKTHKGA